MPVLAAAVAGLAGCGSDDGDNAAGVEDSVVSGDPGRGEEIADDRGCGSCHQPDGLGPPWEGLYGSTVELTDGSMVVADGEYLAESITDPGARSVDGYDIAMPPNELSDEEVAHVVAYIESLGDVSMTSSTAGAP